MKKVPPPGSFLATLGQAGQEKYGELATQRRSKGYRTSILALVFEVECNRACVLMTSMSRRLFPYMSFGSRACHVTFLRVFVRWYAVLETLSPSIIYF